MPDDVKLVGDPDAWVCDEVMYHVGKALDLLNQNVDEQNPTFGQVRRCLEETAAEVVRVRSRIRTR
jgi:hypothetical protein